MEDENELNVLRPKSKVKKRMSKKKKICSGVLVVAGVIAAALVLNHFFNKKDPIGELGKETPLKPKGNESQQVGQYLDDEVLLHSIDTTAVDAEYDLEYEMEYTGFMLPQTLKPLTYTISLIPLLNGNLSFFGEVELKFLVLESTRLITLHAEDLVTLNHTAKIWKENGSEMSNDDIKIIKQTYHPLEHFYRALLDTDLEKGAVYTFALKYRGTLASKMLGFYYSSYKDENNIDRRVAATQFEPSFARRAFPCFDEPAMKANFTIVIARQNNMSTLSNMPRLRETPVKGLEGWSWDVYETSVPMSTYLVAFIVSDFAYLESGTSQVKFKVWSRKSLISNAGYAATLGPKILSFFENFFEIPYPLPKMDMAALPDFMAEAMENWGLITYREDELLIDPKTSGFAHKLKAGLIICHEIAHQWFGNLVSPAWWNDIWLNEGFASYMMYIGMDSIEPSWEVLSRFSDVMRTALEEDGCEGSHPLRVPINKAPEVLDIFDTISYKKGSSVIRMMSHFLTEGTLKRGLSHYLEHLAYQNATQDDLWYYLTLQGQLDGTLNPNMTVESIMNTWTLQMGYPVLTVHTLDKNSISIAQKRFLLGSQTLSKEEDYKWYIPVSFTTETNPNFTNTLPSLWLKPSNDMVIIDRLPTEQWLIFNLQQTGFYRVNYDIENWKLLSQQLQDNYSVIDVRNRAQLLDDSFVLAKNGLLPYDTALRLMDYLKYEKGYAPWKNALYNLDFLMKMLDGTIASPSIKKFVSSIVAPLYEELQLESAGGEDNRINTLELERLVEGWACNNLKLTSCVHSAKTKFQEWMADPHGSRVPPNQRRRILCLGISEGDDAEWKFVWGQYLLSNIAPEKDDFLAALACSQDEITLENYLNKALTSEEGIRKQDSKKVITYVSQSSTLGRVLSWRFLKHNWRQLLEYIGSSFLSMDFIIPEVTKFLKTKEELEQLEEFKVAYNAHPLSAKIITERALKNAQFNYKWMQKYVGEIFQWFFNHDFAK